MPRAFTEGERAAIRARLLVRGRECLASFGLRKTSVADLTGAVGISKGAFYLFFPSKEELFFTVLEEYQTAYQNELLELVGAADGSPAERLRRFLARALTLWRSSPLFRHFGSGDYAALLQRLPAERVGAHLAEDERFSERLLARWAASGLVVPWTATELTALLRGLFLVGLHEAEAGDTGRPSPLALLSELVAAQAGRARAVDGAVTGRGDGNGDHRG